MVSEAFRIESGMDRNNLELIDVGRHDPVPEPPVRHRRLRPLIWSENEAPAEVPPAREFAGLLSELERIAGRSIPEGPVREIRIDLQNSDPEGAVSVVQEMCDLLNDAGMVSPRESLTVELQMWAASPVQPAWLDAAVEANRLQQHFDRICAATDRTRFKTASSAALWPHTDQTRPAMTIVLQVPVH